MPSLMRAGVCAAALLCCSGLPRDPGTRVADAIDAGQLTRARRHAQADLSDATGAMRVELERQLARIALREGDVPGAMRQLTETVRRGPECARWIDSALMLVYLHTERTRDLQRAGELLQRVEAAEVDYPQGRAHLHYYRAAWALRVYDLRTSERDARTALRLARRHGMAALARDAQDLLAEVQLALGQPTAALATYDALLATVSDDPCRKADVLSNLSWVAFLAARQPGERSLRRAHLARAARAQHAARPLLATCGDPFRTRNARLNQAWVQLERGQVDAADAAVQWLSQHDDGRAPQLELWERLLAATVQRRRGDREGAGAALTQALTLARELGDVPGELQARIALGEWAEETGALRRAVREYEHAEALLDDSLLKVPTAAGRGAYVDSQRRSSQGLVRTYLALQDAAAAELAARRALARARASTAARQRRADLSSGDEARWHAALMRYHRAHDAWAAHRNDTWKLSRAARRKSAAERDRVVDQHRQALDELLGILQVERSWQPSETPAQAVRLTLARAGAERWVVFARRGEQVDHAWLPGAFSLQAPVEQLADWILSPFDSHLAEVDQVLVTAHSELWSLDVHALPWRAGPLGAQRPVAYAVDLGRVSSPSASPRALVVADPRNNLPHARLEGRASAQVLRAGFPTQVLQGQEATRERVLHELTRVSLVHFAGHGRQIAERPLGSELLLAGSSSLTTADVLSLSHTPQTVILGACAAAQPTGARARELSFAEAFTVGGSNFVVAPTRPIDDEVSRRVLGPLMGEIAQGMDATRGLRAAYESASELWPHGDWAAFRVVVP